MGNKLTSAAMDEEAAWASDKGKKIERSNKAVRERNKSARNLDKGALRSTKFGEGRGGRVGEWIMWITGSQNGESRWKLGKTSLTVS